MALQPAPIHSHSIGSRLASRPQRCQRSATARRNGGFTLVEIVLVLAITGILAAVAVPNFRTLVYKARRAEAYSALQAIFELETEHFGSFGVYTDSFQEIGFALDGGRLMPDGTYLGRYYTYTLQTMAVGGMAQANFRATAAGDIDPRDAVLDVLVIENQLTVVE